MAKTLSTAFAIGMALFAMPLSTRPASAQTLSAAHDDLEWELDRQVRYAGAGWLESEGGGVAVDFPSSGIDLRSWISLPEFDPETVSANDCWGYVAPSGREYALIGLSLGTAFVEVSDPGNAQIVDVIAGPSSDWRDIKTYQQFAYAVSEGGGGIQVFDLSQIDSGVVSLVNTVTTGGRLQTHNVAVNTESGRLYRAGGGGNNPVNGLRIYSLADPSAPAFVGEWHDRYCHDAQVVTWTEPPYVGVEVAFCYANDTTVSGNPGIEILDVSDPASIGVIGSINLSLPPIFSHPAYYAHQGWLSPDRQYVYFNDEVDEAATGNPTTTRVIDISDLSNPTQVAIFTNGNTARDHNLYTQGELIFESNYRSGLRVFSASNPIAPIEIAYFDTYPDDDNANYNGLWSVYPYLPSGTIIGSDIEKGLFVWSFAAAPVPALSARSSFATAALIAALAAVALRSRRLRDRTLSVAIAALVAAGLGCGSQEASDSVATKSGDSMTAPDQAPPAPGDAQVEYRDGLVTLRSDGSLQFAILEQLAAQAGFAIIAGRVDPRPITLEIERAPLLDAIALILDGLTYAVEYDFDEASGTRTLARVAIGGARGYGSASPAKTPDPTALRKRDQVTETRSDQTESNSDEYSAEQAEVLADLNDPDPEVRADAIFWVDLDGEVLEQMISLLKSEPDAEVRASIVERLGDEESPAAIAAVTGALQDPDPEVVLQAIEVLEFDAEGWLIPELERLLAHPDPEVREAAEDAILYLR